MAADIVLGNICPGHAPSSAHLRARVVARAYKQGGRGMTNGQEGLVCRLIPAFPRLMTTGPRAFTKAIVSNFDPRPKTYPSVPGHLLLFARNSSLPYIPYSLNSSSCSPKIEGLHPRKAGNVLFLLIV